MTDTGPTPLPTYRHWPVPAGPPIFANPIVQCLILLALTSLIFDLFPAIDLWFSGLFYLDGVGFPMNRLSAFVALRDLHRNLTWIVPVALLIGIAMKIVFPWRRSLVSPRDVLFIIASLAIGPGIVANLIFKNHWGRARPSEILQFQGHEHFAAAWQISDGCATNCSFISGEGSSAIWLLTFAVLLPARWRPFGLKILLGFALVFSLNRIAFGGHFLSDVLIAWWINLAIFALLYRLLYEKPPEALSEETLDASVGHAGVALRRLFSRRSL